MFQFASRSSAILYNFLLSNPRDGFFLIPANVCPVVPLTMAKAGKQFYFVDIDETHGMDKNLCLERVKQFDNIAGILYVSPYGKTMDNSDFYGSLSKAVPNALIIEDNCLSKINKDSFTPPYNQYVDLALFSSGYSKYVDIGYGGWGFVKDSLRYHLTPTSFGGEDLRQLQSEIRQCFASKSLLNFNNYNWLDNSAISDVAAYQAEVMSKLEKVEKHKDAINQVYDQLIPDVLKWDNGYQDWRYMLSIKKHRTALIDRIFKAGLFVGTNYPSVTCLFGFQHCSQAEREELEVLNLFNDYRVDISFARNLCKVIKDWYDEYEKDLF